MRARWEPYSTSSLEPQTGDRWCQARSLPGDPMDWTICSTPGLPNLPLLPSSRSLTQISPGQEVKTEVTFFPRPSIEGFVSQAANLVLLRVMAWRHTVPSNARFLALDTEGKLCYSTYVSHLPGRELGLQANQKGQEGC